jgi:DNA-binding response OmpR family regulator
MKGRLLLVEDDPLGGLLLGDMLLELGWQVDGPHARLAEGLRAAREGSFDIAVLDVNLAGEMCFPIAEALAARGIPVVFTTGYDATGEVLARRAEPVLTKPFTTETLGSALRAALRTGAA